VKLGPRIAIVITLLMAGLFTVTATVLLSIRRLDLERDLDRQATELADALAAGLEPLVEATAGPSMHARVEWARQRQGSFRLEILEPDQRPLENWTALVDAAEEADAPAGRLFPPVAKYAMAIPLHNALPGHPQRPTHPLLLRRHRSPSCGTQPPGKDSGCISHGWAEAQTAAATAGGALCCILFPAGQERESHLDPARDQTT